jgi:hypothetical protein
LLITPPLTSYRDLSRAVAAIFFVLLVVGIGSLAQAAVVSSLAGSGQAGIADGPALRASFLSPVGVAWDSKHRLYVSDAAAQRLRVVLPGGTVRTLAGSGKVVATGLWVPGGYADGNGDVARFNVPMGIAVGPNDDVYVADSRNHCIRLMTPEGHVSTFAGNHERVGSTDGPLASATFANPVGVTVDGKGVVYVADAITGVRRISGGQVTTLPLAIPSPLSVAVSPPNTTPMLWVTNSEGLWRIDLTALSKGDVAHAVAHLPTGWYRYPPPPDTPNVSRLIAFGQRSTGSPYAVSVIDELGIVYSDVVSHTIRYYNHETQDLELIGGRATDDSARTGGGFEDGAADQSRFDAPMGIAARSDGVIAVADSGNKRIRLISKIDRRQPFYPFSGVLPNVHFSKSDYRIALVGASIVWGDGLFADSVGGQIETDLLSDPSLQSLHKVPKVMPVRMGSDFGALRSYVELLAEAHFVDAVVVQLSDYTVFDTYGIGDDVRLVGQTSTWQPKMTADLAELQHSLSAAHIPVLFVTHPLSFELTLDEQTLPDVLNLLQMQPPDGGLERDATGPFASAHVNWLDAWPTFYADERSASHRPIFLSLDGHFTPYGNALLGKAIAERLARDKPWLQKP